MTQGKGIAGQVLIFDAAGQDWCSVQESISLAEFNMYFVIIPLHLNMKNHINTKKCIWTQFHRIRFERSALLLQL